MISSKEKILLATVLFWKRAYNNSCPDIAIRPTLEYLLDGISKDVGLSLSVKERNEVMLEYCQRFKKTV